MPKKTRFIKHTDRNKAWNRKRTVAKYVIETVESNSTILIVCEGQTEELYFRAFPVLTLSVRIVDTGGQSKLKLVETTKEILKNETYDKVWCVFDMDYKPDENNCQAQFDNAIEMAHQNNFEVAYSNDAFELWFYLHYQYTDVQNIRTFYYQELGKQWNINYKKEGKKYGFCYANYKRLLNEEGASQAEAIVRAEKLYKAKKDLPFHQQNPVTRVYKLVEYLNENLRP